MVQSHYPASESKVPFSSARSRHRWWVTLCGPVVAVALACGETQPSGTPAESQGGAAQGGAGDQAGAAGSPEPIQACRDATMAFCGSVYDCLGPEELAVLELPELLADCVSEKDQQQGCASGDRMTLCEGFDARAAARCADEAAAASCEDVRSGREFAPHCNRVCEEP